MDHDFKAVVFDVGGVIELSESGNLLEQIAGMLNIPSDKFKHAYWAHNHLSNVENMKWEDMIVQVVRVFDERIESEERVRRFVQSRNAEKKINTGLLKLFPILRHLGLKVAILSNATTELRERMEEKGVAPLIDAIVISAEIGYQKPSKEAFRILFDKLGVRPENVIFVDDSPKSLETSGEIGYFPILFKNNEQLELDLKKVGISLL